MRDINESNNPKKNAGDTFTIMGRRITKRAAILAAVAIIAAVFTVGASAAAIIRAGRVRDLAYTVSPGDGSDASRSAAPWLLGDGYDMVILSGFQGSPEYEGLAEWLNFIAGYECDMDEADYWSKNDPDFVGNKYPMHSVYDSVMEAKLLEIAGKYGLELHDGADLSGEAIPDFLKNGAENWGGYTMGESFHFDGDAQVPGAGNIAYQFMLSKKGRLIEGNLLNVGDASAYAEWDFETESGVVVTLALGPDKALVFAELSDAFVAINVMTGTDFDWLDRDERLTQATLEAFADCFDYSVL